MGRISQKNLQNIYVAFPIGKTSTGLYKYSDPIQVRGQVSIVSGKVEDKDSGKNINYSVTILFSVDEQTRFINELTRIWLYVKPLSNSEPEYMVLTKTEPIDDRFSIFVERIQRSNNDLWYSFNNEILKITVDFDKEELTATIPLDYYWPIDCNSLIWYDEPSSISDTTSLLRLISEKETGTTKTLEFEVVED